MAPRWEAVIAALQEKGMQGDDFEWESYNMEKCVVAGRWKAEKLLRLMELKTYHGVLCKMINNKVIGVDLFSPSRSRFMANVVQKLPNHIRALLFTPFFNGPRSFKLTDASILAPDVLEDRRLPSNYLWPRVVVDVGEYQTLPELCSYRDIYFNTPDSEVQVYVAVKHYLVNPEQMVAVVFYRDSPGGTAISFGKEGLSRASVEFLWSQGVVLTGVGHGGGACDRVRNPEYELKIPTAKFYHNGPNPPPADVPAETIVVDLYAGQTCFLCPERCVMAT